MTVTVEVEDFSARLSDEGADELSGRFSRVRDRVTKHLVSTSSERPNLQIQTLEVFWKPSSLSKSGQRIFWLQLTGTTH